MSAVIPYEINDIHGRPLHRLDLRDEEIDIEDLAVALSNTCRFGKRTPRFYSVGEHAVRCSWAVEQFLRLTGEELNRLALYALLHDAEEAYSDDIPKPEKGHPAYAELVAIQERTRGLVLQHFGLDPELPPEIHEIDMRMRATERRDLFGARGRVTTDLTHRPYDFKIIPMLPDEARGQFMLRFRQLTGTLGEGLGRRPRQEQWTDQGVRA